MSEQIAPGYNNAQINQNRCKTKITIHVIHNENTRAEWGHESRGGIAQWESIQGAERESIQGTERESKRD